MGLCGFIFRLQLRLSRLLFASSALGPIRCGVQPSWSPRGTRRKHRGCTQPRSLRVLVHIIVGVGRSQAPFPSGECSSAGGCCWRGPAHVSAALCILPNLAIPAAAGASRDLLSSALAMTLSADGSGLICSFSSWLAILKRLLTTSPTSSLQMFR